MKRADYALVSEESQAPSFEHKEHEGPCLHYTQPMARRIFVAIFIMGTGVGSIASSMAWASLVLMGRLGG